MTERIHVSALHPLNVIWICFIETVSKQWVCVGGIKINSANPFVAKIQHYQ